MKSFRLYLTAVLLLLTAGSVLAEDKCPDTKTTFTYAPKVITEGEEVSFEGGSSEEGKVTSWEWVISGKKYSGKTVKHTFDSKGLYEALLEAQGEKCVSTRSEDVIVFGKKICSCNVPVPEGIDEEPDKLLKCIKDLGADLELKPSSKEKCAEIKDGLEDDLTDKAESVREEITSYQRLILDPAVKKERKDEYLDKIENDLRPQLKDITAAIGLPEQDPLFQPANAYKEYFLKFNTGYEFLTLDELFQKGLPRIGFVVSFNYRPDEDNPAEHTTLNPYTWRYGMYTFFSALLTSSGEQATTTEDTQQTQSPESALEFDYQIFVPFFRTPELNGGKIREYIGPTFVLGGRKTDNIDRVDHRIYGGLRFQINPELYTDFLVGETQSLDTLRLEVRGQLPVHRFENGSRLFLGAVGNFGLNNAEERQRDKDLVKIYLSWNIDFKTVYKAITGNSL